MAQLVHGPLGRALRYGEHVGSKFMDRLEPIPPDQVPHSAAGWAEYFRQSLNPASAAGALQLATILVPGGRGTRAGAFRFVRPTPGQASLLKAIYRSSRGAKGNKALFENSPETAALAARIGQPMFQRAQVLVEHGSPPGKSMISWNRASNPLLDIQRTGGLGGYEVGEVGPGKFRFDLGGQKLSHLPSGMDVPPLQGEMGDYFPAEPKAAAAQHLFDILMGHNPQN